MKIPKKYQVIIEGEPKDTIELKDVDGEYWANCKDGFWCVLSDSHTLHGENVA